jgi:hypothetical protein
MRDRVGVRVSGLTFEGKSDARWMAAALSSGLHGDPTLSKFVTGEEPGATADAAALVCTKALIGGLTETGVDSGRRHMP